MGEYRKTFVNRIYTVGLTTCGSALVRIAGATESEGFQKVASFVNKWICGGNNTGQTLAEIQALCNEILNEVKIVDQHLKEYDAEIENTLQKIQYTEAKNELNQQWSKDIDVYETAGNVGNTLSAYEDYMKAAQLYMDGKTDINAVEKSKQKLYDNFIEVYKAAGNSFENPTDEKKKDAIFCNDTIDGVFKRSIWSMINALNKPSDEKNYADAAAQFAYRAYGFSGDQYNYIVSSIDKQFMEIIKMEMMYQEFIAQRGDYFEEKYPDDESKWESYAAWTNDLNKLNEDVAKAMDTMLDREILVSDSTVGSIRMKLDEFVKPEDMVSVRMKNENYHEKLTGEFYENEQPIIDAFNEGYLSYDNGFCTKCGGYQPADYNESTGSYEIGNGGQMFWFSALVNGDGEHTQIQEAKPDAHGALVSDISLKNPADENYEWKPIGEFKGIFDGQNHTISDFSMTKVNDESIGFFQSLMSDPNETDEAKKATLKNFTLRTIVTTAEAASAVGGVVGTTSDSVIRRVNSNVNIGSGLIYYIGGIVGEINAAKVNVD